ncbi:hypothetical protein M422DRAFT_273444 [Sphaerobolus stellatus SS14]|uniref:Chromo domain-containing protein n=1 Tax=Sphaerobolus stellatus (strain SS14) TaxID=990650 RepID=A0A0C9T925_SPHS4|nr:hypothetical protein M422DRAFT_273444 [Sphaerobolus stellatus SS14]
MTGTLPFFTNKDHNPNLVIHPEYELASSRAQDYISNLDELHQERPFEIIAKPGPVSVTLCLPQDMHAVHPVFHVLMLEPYMLNTIPNRIEEPPPPVTITIDKTVEYEISQILDSKIDKHRKCKLQYLVSWLGYEGTDQEKDWLTATKLEHTKELVADFHKAYPDKPGPHLS